MAGWPARISRAALGPKRVDLYPAPNDTNFVRDVIFNTLFWQLAGANLFSPKVSGIIDGAAGTLSSSDEAWATDGAAAPTFSKVGTGQYRLTYAATYKDEEDKDVAPALRWARGFVQGSTNVTCVAEVTNGVQIDIRTFTASTGTAVDAKVYFEAG